MGAAGKPASVAPPAAGVGGPPGFFVKKEISCTIQLDAASGSSFGGNNTVTLDGLRVKVHLTRLGNPTLDTCDIQIWGMKLSDMNACSRLGKPLTYTRNNVITVNAGDAESGMAQLFSGYMNIAYVDLSEQPEGSLVVQGIAHLVDATTAIGPTTFKSPSSIDTIMNQLASKMGKNFLNSGVPATILRSGGGQGGPYFSGSIVAQIRAAAAQANCWVTLDGGSDGMSVEIWPKGTARGAMGPSIGPMSGLVGYPKYTDLGIMIRRLYQPGLSYGQAFTLETSIEPAKGTWYVLRQEIELGCNDPGGDNPWYDDIEAQRTVDTSGAAASS